MSTFVNRRLYVYTAYLRYPKQNEVTGLIDDVQADVKAVMNQINQLPRAGDVDPSNYLSDKGGEAYSSFTIDHAGDEYILGQFARTRFYGIPKTEGGGVRESLQLPSDRGIYEASHFAYLIQDERMVYEANAYAPRVSTLAKYIELKSNSQNEHFINSAVFVPLVRGENIDYFLNGLDAITEIEIEIPETYVDVVSLKNAQLGDTFQKMRDFSPDSPRYSIVLRAELHQRKGGFTKIKEGIAQLAREIPDAFTKIKGKAKPTHDPSQRAQYFDLLQDKLTTSVPVLVDKDRHVDSDDIYGRIIDFYNAIRGELQN